MKVYTTQFHDFLEHTDEQGFIIPQRKELDEFQTEWYTDLDPVFQWMRTQYGERTGLPLDRDLIWVFDRPRYVDFDKNNNNLFDLHEASTFVFEVPMEHYLNSILWSDYNEWHLHLNYLEGWETEFGIFDLNVKKYDAKHIVPQGVTTRLHKDWIKKIYRNKEKCHGIFE